MVTDRIGQQHNLDPQRYLTSVLAKLPLLDRNECGSPSGGNPERLVPFLPDVWKREDAAESPAA